MTRIPLWARIYYGLYPVEASDVIGLQFAVSAAVALLALVTRPYWPNWMAHAIVIIAALFPFVVAIQTKMGRHR